MLEAFHLIWKRFISLAHTRSGAWRRLGIITLNFKLKINDDRKHKIRKAKVGLIHSEETKKKMSISRNKWKHTKESKQKMSDNMQRAKILNTETGEIHVGYNSVMPLINMKRTTFMAQLTGQNKNKTKYKLI